MEITQDMVVKWLREKGDEYHRMAEKLDASPKEAMPGFSLSNGNGAKPAQPATVTAEQVRSYLAKKGARRDHLAAHFHVDREIINKIVADETNGIIVGDRGWLAVIEG